MATLLSQLASDLKNAIVKVKKVTGGHSSSPAATEDSLFLLSEVEVFGYTKYANGGEGSQYEYYQSGNSRRKTVNESASCWWERSPLEGGNATAFSGVSTSGDPDFLYASQSYGVAFAFCV